ncbi:hypothetical protein LPJ71_005613, partial [Coemansia sp. S17]
SAKFPKTLWRIESNVNEKIPKSAPLAEYRRPSLIEKVLEATAVMWRVNNGLTKSHPYESRPHTWPWMRRGMAFWGADNRSIYLLGTPIIWWLSFGTVVIFAGVQVVLFFRDRRGFRDRLLGARERYMESVGFLSIGWVLHWIPFFLMGRQLFLHHYLPALWLAILALVGSIDLFTRRLSRKVRQVIMFALLLATVRMYFQYSHIAYGSSWTREGCERSKWLKSWDYDCYRFPEMSAKAPVAPALKPNVPEIPMPTMGAPDIGGQPVAIMRNKNGEVVANAPPPAQNFDPLEHENKLNEPAPEIHQDHLNSNSAKLDLEMKKKATTVEPANNAAGSDEHVAGEH